jgi:hypothetical protein
MRISLAGDERNPALMAYDSVYYGSLAIAGKV